MRRLLLFLVLLLTLPGWANVVKDANTEAELVSSVRSLQPGQPVWVALRLKMDEGWHTYWKNAGDAGMATTVAWELPPGYSVSEIEWPYPHKSVLEGLVSYYYEGEVYLPMKLAVPTDAAVGETVTLKARADWLACQEICIPGTGELTLDLPVTAEVPEPSDSAAFIESALADVPKPASTVKAGWDGDNIALLFPGDRGAEVEAEFMPAEPMMIDDLAPQPVTAVEAGHLMILKPSPLASEKPARLTGVLLIKQGAEVSAVAVDVSIAVQPPVTVGGLEKASAAGPGLGLVLLFALLGGALLNLMPCVFPVLSLKVLGFVEQSREEGQKPFLHGLVFAGGVLVSFWVLAGLLLMLQRGGEELGWGFQLQSPGFVAAMAVLFFLIGLNLFGVFEVGEGLTALGDSGHESSYRSSFGSGVLATLVATPCTAPGMGTAIGYTLDKPPAVSLAIFTLVGLGMALPYVVLTAAPGLLRLLPRPGAWMESFKQFMGFPMMATAVWLAWVFGGQTGHSGMAALLLGLVLLGLGAWAWGRWGGAGEGLVRIRAAGLTVLSVVAGLSLVFSASGWSGPSTASDSEWKEFSPELVAQLRAEGKPVFVDFTASWCLSCQVNERVALAPERVRRRFEELGVEMVKADWTNRDEVITRALAEFGRNGVPLYVLYPGGEEEPVVLPEILTPQIVLDALERVERPL